MHSISTELAIPDIAASIQKVLEEIVFKIVTHISTLHKSKNLCLAGGVALNCVANGKLLKKKIFPVTWTPGDWD